MADQPDAPVLDKLPLPLTTAQREAAFAAAAAQVAKPENVVAAEKRIAELQRDPEFFKRLHGGDPAAKKEWAEANAIAATFDSAGAERLTQQVGALARFNHIDPNSDVGADLVAMLAGKNTVTPELHRSAKIRLDALKADKVWVQKYLDDDVGAKQTLAALSAVLAAKVQAA
jgi:hypothetical protein